MGRRREPSRQAAPDADGGRHRRSRVATTRTTCRCRSLIGTRGWGMFVAERSPGRVRRRARRADTRRGHVRHRRRERRRARRSTCSPPTRRSTCSRTTTTSPAIPGLPAPWALGPLLWRDENSDQAQVLDDIPQIRTRHLATTGIWFDRPYATGVKTFDCDATKFPDPHAMLAAAPRRRPALRDLARAVRRDRRTQRSGAGAARLRDGARLLPADDRRARSTRGASRSTSRTPRRTRGGSSNLRVHAPLDGGSASKASSSTTARTSSLGLHGQRTPWQFADGSDERTMHYGYTLLYHQIYRELLAQAAAFCSRAPARWGDQTHGMIIWPGDLDANLRTHGDPIADGEDRGRRLAGGAPIGLWLSASGFPFYASDTGGYRNSPPNNETWLRWVEANAVWPRDAGRRFVEPDAVGIHRGERSRRSTRSTSIALRAPAPAAVPVRVDATRSASRKPAGRSCGRSGSRIPSSACTRRSISVRRLDLLVAPVDRAGATSRAVVSAAGQNGSIGGRRNGSSAGTIDRRPRISIRCRCTSRAAASCRCCAIRSTRWRRSSDPSAIDSFANDAGVLRVRVAPGPEFTAFDVYDGTQAVEQRGRFRTRRAACSVRARCSSDRDAAADGG